MIYEPGPSDIVRYCTAIYRILPTLLYREEMVLRLRFGLSGESGDPPGEWADDGVWRYGKQKFQKPWLQKNPAWVWHKEHVNSRRSAPASILKEV